MLSFFLWMFGLLWLSFTAYLVWWCMGVEEGRDKWRWIAAIVLLPWLGAALWLVRGKQGTPPSEWKRNHPGSHPEQTA